MEDAGTYAVQAKNELGTDSAHMELNVRGKNKLYKSIFL